MWFYEGDFKRKLWPCVRDSRVRPRFFDQVGHETMYASRGNKHFFTKLCHRQTYQNYEKPPQTSQNLYFKIGQIFPKKNQKDSVDFWCWRITLQVRILQSLRRLFMILVGLMMTWFSEKILISTRCICTCFHIQLDQKILAGIYMPHYNLEFEISWSNCLNDFEIKCQIPS